MKDSPENHLPLLMRKPKPSPHNYHESSSSRMPWLHLTWREEFQISHLYRHASFCSSFSLLLYLLAKKIYKWLLCRNFASFMYEVLYFYLTYLYRNISVCFLFFNFSWPKQESCALLQIPKTKNGNTLNAICSSCSLDLETEDKARWRTT